MIMTQATDRIDDLTRRLNALWTLKDNADASRSSEDRSVVLDFIQRLCDDLLSERGRAISYREAEILVEETGLDKKNREFLEFMLLVINNLLHKSPSAV